MNWRIERTGDQKTCFALRHAVFVEEQGVPAKIEVDEHDSDAVHLLASLDDRAVGTARVLFAGEVARIGRVCLLAAVRGAGLGAALIERGVALAAEQPQVGQIRLGAQVSSIVFYEKLGFNAYGPVIDSAGIDHRDMVRDLR